MPHADTSEAMPVWYRAPLTLGKNGDIEIARLAAHPLLLFDTSFVTRRTFDATCSLAGVEPNVVFESRTPHTLLAMAEKEHGVAIVPSAVRIARYPLRIVRVTYRGKSLREPLALFWDKRRPLPSFATAFCAMMAQRCANCSRFRGSPDLGAAPGCGPDRVRELAPWTRHYD